MSEKQKIIRALKAIEDISLPQSGIGTKTISTKGIYDYQNDMREAKPHIANIRWALFYKEYIDEKDVIALEKIANKDGDQ